MAYLVEKLASRGCITIAEDAKVLTLLELLGKHNVGAVMAIGANQEPKGIVSERDVVRSLASEHIDINATSVSEIMSKEFISCDLSTTSSGLMEIMTRNKIRHIPIVENGDLVGMVSIGDVVGRLIEIYEAENEQLRTYINS